MEWSHSSYIAFDFETSGTMPEYALQPWRVAQKTAWATSFATVHVAGSGDEARPVFGGGLNPTRKMMAAFLERAIAEKRRIVGWHVAFDIQWLLAYGLEELVMRAKWLDGMLLWRHAVIEPEYEAGAGKRKSYGLKNFVAGLWSHAAGYEDDVDFHDSSPQARQTLHNYNQRDTLFTLQAAQHLWGELEPRQQAVALIEAESLPLVAAANLRGMVVDTLVCSELRQHLIDVASDRLERLQPLGVTEAVVRSPMQLAALMFDNWGLPVVKTNTTAGGKTSRSTDKEVMHELALGYDGEPPDPRVACLREYREALNNRTKFADALLDSVNYNQDGCTHPQAMVFGTYTGRLTYGSRQKDREAGKRDGTLRNVLLPTGFALHQEKRDKRYREPIKAPQGFTIMEFDAAGQEFRWMAIASGDVTMLGLCQPGEDAHSFMGASINGWDYRETIARYRAGDPEVAGPQGGRMLGKVANLSLQYRTSAKKLRVVARVDYSIPMRLSEAEHVYVTYRRTYPGVPRYWDRQIDLVKHYGYAETLAGRRVTVVGNWAGNLAWSMASTAINYRIQGTGADQKYLALAVLGPYLKTIGAHFAWDMHDGIYLYVPDARVAEAAAEGKRLLDNLPYKRAWGLTPPVPLPWDCKVGASWGTLKEWVQ